MIEDEIMINFQKMIKKATNVKSKLYLKLAEVKDVIKNHVEQFVCQKMKNFFTKFHISLTFLMKPCLELVTDESFLYVKEIVSKIKVVNDVVERVVLRLITEYRDMTKNKEQQQFILQIVINYCEKFLDEKEAHLCLNIHNEIKD